MHPTLLEIPSRGLELPSHQAALLTAVLLCLWVGPRWARRLEGVDPRTTRSVLLWLGVAAFAGGRAHFVWNAWPFSRFSRFSRHPLEMLEVWRGLHAGGAIVALALAAPIVLRAHGLVIGRFSDALAPTVGVGIAVARLGCFLAGCCFGTPCEAPWCLAFPRGSAPFDFQVSSGVIAPDAVCSAPIQPLQLYFALAGLLATGAAF